MSRCCCMDIFCLFPFSAAQPTPLSQVDDIALFIQAASADGASAPRQEPSDISAKFLQQRAMVCQHGHLLLSRGLGPVLAACAPAPVPITRAGISGQSRIRRLRNPAAAPEQDPAHPLCSQCLEDVVVACIKGKMPHQSPRCILRG